MKQLVTLSLIAQLAWSCASHSPDGPPGPPPRPPDKPRAEKVPGALQLLNVPVSTVLDLYRGLIGKELVIAPEVEKSPARISLNSKENMTKAEAARVLEKALREAGIRIEPLDEHRVSVAVQ
jgi:hypothetical protein